jgi:hypothetical protein
MRGLNMLARGEQGASPRSSPKGEGEGDLPKPHPDPLQKEREKEPQVVSYFLTWVR